MHIFLENRAEHSIGYLQPEDAKRVYKFLNSIEAAENFEIFKNRFKSYKSPIHGTPIFVFKVTPDLRILFRYGKDESLLIEDIVSRKFLEKFFREKHG